MVLVLVLVLVLLVLTQQTTVVIIFRGRSQTLLAVSHRSLLNSRHLTGS